MDWVPVLYEPFLVTVLLIAWVPLAVWLASRRFSALVSSHDPRISRWSRGHRQAAAGAFALLVQLPLLIHWPAIFGDLAVVPGDGAAHMSVARQLAEEGFNGGWLAEPSGGFPFALHYPPGAVLVLSLIMKLGVGPIVATNLVGLAATLATPILLAVLLVRRGVGLGATFAAVIVVSWTSAYFNNIGLYSAYFAAGRLSQVTTVPILVALAGAISGTTQRSLRALPLLSILAVTFHANLAVVAFAVALPPALLHSRTSRLRFVIASACAASFAVALHGPGLYDFGLPFGFNDLDALRLIGFSPGRFSDAWLSGDLLDLQRTPWVSAVTLVAALGALIHSRQRSVATALVFLLGVVAVPLGSHALPLIPGGAAILEVFSPRRVLVLLPLALGVLVAIMWDRLAIRVRTMLDHTRWRAVRWTVGFTLPALLLLTLGPERLNYFERWEFDVRTLRRSLPRDTVVQWLEGIDERRIAFDIRAFPQMAPAPLGVDALAGRSWMNCLGGPCGHVGGTVEVLTRAPWDGSEGARAAEALGIRWLLTRTSVHQGGNGWRVYRRHGDLVLLERTGGTDLVGVGCQARRWVGTEEALRNRLFTSLEQGTYPYDPHRLIVLAATDESRGDAASNEGPCDPQGAQVREAHSEPGRFAAEISTLSPVEIVFRTSALRTFRVTSGKRSLNVYRVAPGFPAVHVGPGVHRIVASASLPAYYFWGLLAALALAAGLTRALWNTPPGVKNCR